MVFRFEIFMIVVGKYGFKCFSRFSFGNDCGFVNWENLGGLLI